MRTRHGLMSTERPGRYAKQLAGHWATRGELVEDGPTTTLRFDTGQVLVLRAVEGGWSSRSRCPRKGELRTSAPVHRQKGTFAGIVGSEDRTWPKRPSCACQES